MDVGTDALSRLLIARSTAVSALAFLLCTAANNSDMLSQSCLCQAA